MAASEVEQVSLASEYKKWVLKVPIHCPGCEKKVRKILDRIDGVKETEIDLKQQKVTVTGNVDSDTLIRRLVKKTKKPAGLWPEKPPATDNKSEKEKSKANRDVDGGDKNRDRQTEARSEDPSSSGGKNRDLQTQAKSEDPSSSGGGAPAKSMDGGGSPAEDTSSGATGKVTSDDGDPGCLEKKSDSGSPEMKSGGKPSEQSPAPVPEHVPENKSDDPAPAGGNGGKKKKRKGQKRNVNVADGASTSTPASVGTPAGSGSSLTPASQTTVNNPSNPSPPRQRAYRQEAPPPPRHQHAAPASVLSYNTARPTGVHGASYYTPPLAQSSYSHAYEVAGDEFGPPSYNNPYPAYYNSPYPQPPPDLHSYPPQPPEFELFSDENANGCRVM